MTHKKGGDFTPAFMADLVKAGIVPGAAPPSLDDVSVLNTIKSLSDLHGKTAEAFLFPLLSGLLDKAALPVKQEPVRTAAAAAASAIVLNSSPAAIRPVLLPILLGSLDGKKKWQTRVAALNLLSAKAKLPSSAEQISNALVQLVPTLVESICDARADVATAAEAAMLQCCLMCGNGDLDAVIPTIVSAMARPSEVPETIHAVSATTFVKAVEMPTLAVLVPLLERGLTERVTSVKRMTAVIIENMTKLVLKREHAAPLLPKLLPGLQTLRDEVADPECRNVASRTFGVLLSAAGVDEATATALYTTKGGKAKAAAPEAGPVATYETEAPVLYIFLEEALEKHAEFAPLLDEAAQAKAGSTAAFFATSVKHVSALTAELSLSRNYEQDAWNAAVTPYLAVYAAGDATVCDKTASELRTYVIDKNGGVADDDYVEEVDDGTPDLCKAEFSLAYGAKTLLNTAKLHLKVGKKYGLIGPERCGKSTLMRAIANGQLEGFPSKDVVRTVYVDSTIKVEDADFSVTDFVVADPDVISGGAGKDLIMSTLTSLGFTATMLAGAVGRLSGGWRCKLALARAQLSRSDIYLLDEPTNHLDVKNTAWLINYLNTLTTTTCIMVSHDSHFLDTTCSHIIHFEGFKLRTYRGNLSEFVKQKPEAKSYYDLASSNLAFHFPAPGFLEGIKSKDRAILKVAQVSITYPGRETPVLTEVTLNCSLSSRVVVLGANGAGKSTLIKTIVGEMLPSAGSVWRHPNLRIAYVAQDAFHHLNLHLKSTPSEYIQWRYATGEDREALSKATSKVTESEEKLMVQAVVINGVKMTVSRVLNRRKSGRSYEYEVEWVGQSPDKNQWMPREWLAEHGWGKAVDALDAREAAAAGLHSRPLTAANIAAHLQAVGLDPEQALHSRINALSGGQLIKVVIGAAMWMNPHLLIMDEPTNFLDRDSLGALAAAIKEFEGGVLLITHHHDFTKELCGETWTVADGKCLTVGQSWDSAQIEKSMDADETVDAAGNVIKVVKKLTGKLLKAHLKEKKERRKRGEEVSSDEEEA